MQNLIQVQSLNMQQPGMATLGGNGGLGMNMGGVLIENRYPNSQMQPPADHSYPQDMKGGQKVQRRPSTNKMSHDQNSMQQHRMM